LLDQNQHLSRAVEAERNFRTLEIALAAFSAKIREVGLEPDDTVLQTNVEIAIARINLVSVLRTLLDELGTAQKALSISLSAQTSVTQVHAQIRPLLLNAIAEAKAALAVIEQQRQAISATLAVRTETAKKIAVEREGLERRIHQDGSRLQILRSGWQTLGGDRDWTDKALSEISAALRRDHETQQKVDQALVQAETVLLRLVNIEELTQLRTQLVPLIAERDRLNRYSEAAAAIKEAYGESRQKHVKQQMKDFVRVISALFIRMQSNLVYDDILSGDEDAPLSWRAIAEDYSLDPEAIFSQGQRQDFALSIFLARARGLGGTFILDEPVAHLDDLNRVALLDVFRAITLEDREGLSFVLTTANKPLVRHMIEKFACVDAHSIAPHQPKTKPALLLVGLEGNPRTGVRLLQDAELNSADL
jgi:exonuclease SbcC